MRQPERLADLPLGQRLVADHQVGVDPPDRRSDAPRRAHLAPGLGELETESLRRSDGLAGPAVTVIGNVRLDSSEFVRHNLLCESSTEGRGHGHHDMDGSGRVASR